MSISPLLIIPVTPIQVLTNFMVDLDLVWVNFFGDLGQLYSGGDNPINFPNDTLKISTISFPGNRFNNKYKKAKPIIAVKSDIKVIYHDAVPT